MNDEIFIKDKSHKENMALLIKVPEITLLFWVAKVLSTAMGESLSDFIFFNDTLGKTLGFLIGLGFYVITLVIQLASKRYTPWIYWMAVSGVSIFGTMGADILNTDLGIPLYVSTTLFLIAQAVVFLFWYITERDISIHSVIRGKRELMYWATVLFTFALGTAAGDFTADTLQWGTLKSGIVFFGIIAIPAIGHFFFQWNKVFCFWFAYTITRPLGASFSDWLSVPKPYGDGLGLGTGKVGLVLAIVLLAVIVIIVIKHNKENQYNKNEIALK